MTHKFLFVCMGNICRSPTVAVVAKQLFASAGVDVIVDSAGTEDYHIGQSADARSIRIAKARGYDLVPHRARQVEIVDFSRFDWILAMDRVNLNALRRRFPRVKFENVALFLEHAGEPDPFEVPDPYYSGDEAFGHVIDLAETGARGLIDKAR